MVVYACNPRTLRLRQEDYKSEASLSTQRDPVSKKRAGDVAQQWSTTWHAQVLGFNPQRHTNINMHPLQATTPILDIYPQRNYCTREKIW
jgi:hypothetical protein